MWLEDVISSSSWQDWQNPLAEYVWQISGIMTTALPATPLTSVDPGFLRSMFICDLYDVHPSNCLLAPRS